MAGPCLSESPVSQKALGRKKKGWRMRPGAGEEAIISSILSGTPQGVSLAQI